LTPGVDFTNVFVRKDPKITKRHWWLDCLFTLVGSFWAKAAHKMLVKSTPGVNFINVPYKYFMCADPKRVKRYWWLHKLNFYALGSACVKAAHRTLMKLTPGFSISTTFICVHIMSEIITDHWPQQPNHNWFSDLFRSIDILTWRAHFHYPNKSRTGLEFTNLLEQICKIFCNFNVLLRSSHS